MAPTKRIRDPMACARKYFVAASVSWFVLAAVISGINLNILISNMIHAVNQFGVWIIARVLIIIVTYNK